MTCQSADDPVLSGLGDLKVLTPDALRTERVRARCRARMERIERRIERRHARRALLEAALVGGLSILYLVAVVRDALRLQGVL